MKSKRKSLSTREVSIYKPFRAGLPNLREYFSKMWDRRELAIELSRSELRAQQATTVLGQFWLVLNPLFLALVYFTLVVILSGNKIHGTDFLAHLLAGLFVYHYVTQCFSQGAASVVSVGKLITNRSFPRLLLPISAVLVSFRRFVPTLIVYFIFHTLTQQPWNLNQLAAIPALILLTLFAIGMATMLATAQIYFRDTKSFLPYLTRILMYLSPILYYSNGIIDKLEFLRWANPMFSLITCWSDALVRGEIAPLQTWVLATVWSLLTFFSGLFVFLTREREFAVRI